MQPMPTRPILVRVALAVLLMVVPVVLADGITSQELQQAMGDTATLGATGAIQ